MANNYEDIKCSSCDNLCPAKGYQDVTFCVPVEIKPFAEISKVKVKCLGEPGVCSFDECKGYSDNSCCFTIKQKVRVEVPVAFGAKTEVGKTCIDCDCAKVKVAESHVNFNGKY